MTVATYLIGATDTADAPDVDRVTAALVELGFVFEPVRPAETTLLDTFDGRLHRAGLRLELHQANAPVLVMSGAEVVPARLAVPGPPATPDALPAGPFRARLERLTGLRALLPVLSVRADRRDGVWRDAAGKVVATVHVDERARVVVPVTVDGLPAVVEVHEAVGYAKAARLAREALDALGLAPSEGDATTHRAAAAGVDLAGFRATMDVPLDPTLPAVDGFRAVLANQARAIRANWAGTIERADTEFLHDLRIALRRTRTVLGEARGVLPEDVRTAARQDFAWLAGLTGPARDLDVYLLEWGQYVDPLGPEAADALGPLRAVLARQCDDAHAELEQALRSPRATELMDRWTAWLDAPLDGAAPAGDRADRPLGPRVAKRIVRAQTIVIERGRLIEPATPAERVHDLRKDAKKLRYVLECFGPLLPDAPRKRFVKRLKALQDTLGEHQDAEVHVAMLDGIAHQLDAAGASTATMIAIGRLTERLEQQRHRARDDFADRFADYDTAATRRALQAMVDGIGP